MANLPRDMQERFYRILGAAPGASVDVEKYRDLINFVPVTTAAEVMMGFTSSTNNSDDDSSTQQQQEEQQQEERPLKIVPLVWPDFDTRPVDWKGHSLRVFAHVMTQNIDNWHGMNPEDQINEKFLESYFQGMSYGKLFQGFSNFTFTNDPNKKRTKSSSSNQQQQDAAAPINTSSVSSSSKNENRISHGINAQNDTIPRPSRDDLPASVMERFKGPDFEHRSMPFDYFHSKILNKYNTNIPGEMSNVVYDRYVNRFRNSGMGNYVPAEHELSNMQLDWKKKELRLQQKKKNMNNNNNNNNNNDDDDAAAVAVASSDSNNNEIIKITHADYRPRHHNNGRLTFYQEERDQKKFYFERGLELADNPHYYDKDLAIRHDFSKSIFSDEVRGLTTVYQRQKQQRKQQMMNNNNNTSSKYQNETSSNLQQD